MPLRDHFRTPNPRQRQWSSVHAAWATYLTAQLNERLPARYFAGPYVHRGGQAQVDIGTTREEEGAARNGAPGGTATAVWAPPRPTMTAVVDSTDPDAYEVQVRVEEEGIRLVAAVELVSPANKDRPSHRQAFAAKCASMLQQQVGLVVVDIVTRRAASLHAALLDLLGLPADEYPAGADLYAVAYRIAPAPEAQRLEMWPHALAVGGPLPVVPLWIDPEVSVPLDLDAPYETACRSLRMP